MKQFSSPKIRHKFRLLFTIIQIILDAALFNLCLWLVHSSLTLEVHAILTAAMFVFFLFNRLYGFGLWTFREEIISVCRAWILIFIVSILYFYVNEISVPFMSFIIALVLFVPLELNVRYFFRRFLSSHDLLSYTVIIIGAGLTGEMLAESIGMSPFISRHIIGFLDDDESKKGQRVSGIPILGTVKDIQSVQAKVHADEAVITMLTPTHKALADIRSQIEGYVKRIFYIPDMYMLNTYSVAIRRIDDLPVISASQGLLNPVNRFIKSIMDYVGGFIAFILLSPLMIYVALKIKREDKGKILFKQQRIGSELKPFYVYKFRSMVPNAEEILKEMLKDEKLRKEFEEEFKFKDDPRITEIGKFLRRTSLDELPQIFNVLKGEMSLVGPRPVVQKEIDSYYGEKTAKQIFRAKPGMTGLWQVSGRNDVKDYTQRIEYDFYYIHNWSVWLDFYIMFCTFSAVFKGKGAY